MNVGSAHLNIWVLFIPTMFAELTDKTLDFSGVFARFQYQKSQTGLECLFIQLVVIMPT